MSQIMQYVLCTEIPHLVSSVFGRWPMDCNAAKGSRQISRVTLEESVAL